MQIFVELPKFDGGIEDITEDTPFVEQLAHVLMEMADCESVPANLTNPLLRRLFDAADTSTMEENVKKAKALEIGGSLKKAGVWIDVISSSTGLSTEEIESL